MNLNLHQNGCYMIVFMTDVKKNPVHTFSVSNCKVHNGNLDMQLIRINHYYYLIQTINLLLQNIRRKVMLAFPFYALWAIGFIFHLDQSYWVKLATFVLFVLSWKFVQR